MGFVRHIAVLAIAVMGVQASAQEPQREMRPDLGRMRGDRVDE